MTTVQVTAVWARRCQDDRDDRVDDDKHGDHTEIGNTKTEYQLISNDYATLVEISASEP